MKYTPKQLKQAKEALKIKLSNIPDINGIGIGTDSIRVNVSNKHVKKLIPRTINGIPVKIVVISSIKPK